MKTEIVSFNYGELVLPVEALEQCHHSGRCDDDVAFWVPQIDWASQSMGAEAIRKELGDSGAYSDEELADDEQNKHRILWFAAADWQEGRE
jgi:hypothetical protein